MQPISSYPVLCSGHSRSTFNNAGASRWKPLCRVHKWTLVYFIAQFSSIWKWNDALSCRLRLFVLSNRNNKRKIRTGSELGTFADVALVALFRAKVGWIEEMSCVTWLSSRLWKEGTTCFRMEFHGCAASLGAPLLPFWGGFQMRSTWCYQLML